MCYVATKKSKNLYKNFSKPCHLTLPKRCKYMVYYNHRIVDRYMIASPKGVINNEKGCYCNTK